MAPRRLAVVLLLGALAAASLLLAGSATVDAAAAPGRVVAPADTTVLPRTAAFVDGTTTTTHAISDSGDRRRLDPPRSGIPADDSRLSSAPAMTSCDTDAPVPARNASEAADTVLLLLLPRTPPVPVAAGVTPGTDDDAKACGAFLRLLGEVFLSGVFLGFFCSWLRDRYVKAEARRVVKATAAGGAAV